MFVYHYRLFDRFQAPVASFAVLADEDDAWRPVAHREQTLGTVFSLQFSVAKLLDHEPRLDALEHHPNPFALVTAAHLMTRRTRGEPLQRYAFKLSLIRLLYSQGWDRTRVIQLLRVLDWMVRLPTSLNHQLWQDIDAFEAERPMKYYIQFERDAMERGFQQGRQEGQHEGRLEGQAAVLEHQLTRRFGALPESVRQQLLGATPEQLLLWADRVLEVSSLAEVMGTH